MRPVSLIRVERPWKLILLVIHLDRIGAGIELGAITIYPIIGGGDILPDNGICFSTVGSGNEGFFG